MAHLSSLAINLPTSILGRYGLKGSVKAAVALVLLLGGCAGSPHISITKNVYVIENSAPVFVGYSTESTTKSDAEITQDLQGELDLQLPVP